VIKIKIIKKNIDDKNKMVIKPVTLGDFIKVQRNKRSLTQEDIAKAIGITRQTLNKIESSSANLDILQAKKLSQIFNISLDDLYECKGLLETPFGVVEEERFMVSETDGIRMSIPKVDFIKLRETILYILNKVGAKPNIGETVLYKLLYFIDFDFYEKYEEQFLGCTYIKNHHGPTPIEFVNIIDRMIDNCEIEKIKSEYFKYPQTKYLALRMPNLKVLKASELALIDEVLCRLSEKNANQISEYSHNDVPWITAEDGKPINYESVFYRTKEYSVRIYDQTN
jgi:DNA-binding XRE family transcriptional regulator